MTNTLNSKTISINSIWFGLFALYVVVGYFAQDVILPSMISSLTLYVFLGYSVFAIIASGKIKPSPIVKWEIACLAASFIAMLYSPSFSIFGGTYYMLIVNFVIVFILTQMPWTRERFVFVMKAFVFAAAGLIIVLALTGNLQDSSDSGRLGQDLTGNANILACMLMVAAIYAMWLLMSSKKKSVKFISFIALLVIYFGMFLSGGRKYVIMPLIFLYILMMHKGSKKGRLKIISSTFIIAIAALVVYLLIMKVPFFYNIIGVRFEGFFEFLGDNQGKADSSTLLRYQMIDAAWEKWLERPLFGYGFDSFKYYNEQFVTGHRYYSHNNFLELLYNQGIVGFAIYYSFYVYLVIKAWRLKNNFLYRGFIIGAVVAWLLFEYYGVTYSTTPTQIMLCLALNISSLQEQANN